jgi:protein tyrosine/serine phosphatase
VLDLQEDASSLIQSEGDSYAVARAVGDLAREYLRWRTQTRLAYADRLPKVGGIHYTAKVTDTLYRGSFPNAKGVEWLREQGVRTIINLNGHVDNRYGETVLKNGMRYVHIPLSPSRAPSEESVAKFFSVLGDRSSQPVYVHCLHGVDRTGTMIALFRIREQKWRNEDALAEMIYFKDHGFKQLRDFVARYSCGYSCALDLAYRR